MAIGLAMDSFAVSLCQGLASPHGYVPRYFKPILMALLFGFFHACMPLVGYMAGTLLVSFFERYAPWIALLLLGFIGGKMIYDSFQKEDKQRQMANFSFINLLSLAFATSMDTLATGVIFIPYPDVLWLAIMVIAVTCFVFSMIGFVIGHLVGVRFRFNVTLFGGIILILIGIKICLEGLLT